MTDRGIGRSGRFGMAPWFANRSIRAKILISLLMVTVVATGAAVVALQRMSVMDGRLARMHSANITNLSLLNTMYEAQSKINHEMLLMTIATSAGDRDDVTKAIHDAAQRLETALSAYQRQPKSAEASKVLADLQRQWTSYSKIFSGDGSAPAPSPAPGAAAPEGLMPLSAVNQMVLGVSEAMGQLCRIEDRDAQRATAAAHDDYDRSRWQVTVVLAVGWLVALALAVLAATSITRRLTLVVTAAKAMATGDLSQSVMAVGRDEIGMLAAAVNEAVGELRDTVSQLAEGAGQLSRDSVELTEVTDAVAGNARAVLDQARSTDEVAVRLSRNLHTVASGAEEMSSSIKEIARNANEGAQVARQAVAAVNSTNETVAKLGASSQEIGNVVKMITAIAEQTNLLALNATIEAARAGDAGKGFAVVASEVKELAQETAKATADVTQRIHTIQDDSGEAVDAIARISAIIEQIHEYQIAIASAVEQQTTTTDDMNRNVATAADGVGQIVDSIADVSEAADATTRQVTAGQQSAHGLAELATDMHGLASRFSY